MNRDDGIGIVMLAAKHGVDFCDLDFAVEGIERTLQFRAHILALLGPFEKHGQIIEFSRNGSTKLEIVGETTTALESFLGLGLVFPEVRSGNASFERG